MSVLICPVCGGDLIKSEKSYKCPSNHSFDIAKEGYVNLLQGSKSGDKMGDSRESAKARHAFHAKNYYIHLKNEITKRMSGRVLDICCGEGYYDDYDGEIYGFDISREMVRLASRSNKNAIYFVSNLAKIPVKDNSIDTAVHLFAPFKGKEFARILKENGRLYSVIPGENHLIELKNAVYDTPYKNDEQAPVCDELSLISKTKISDRIDIPAEDVKTLFSMTPYYYRTSEKDKAKLDNNCPKQITFEFVILEYKKSR